MAEKKTSKSESKVSPKSSSKNVKSTMHPNYRVITVEMTNGTTFETRSTYPNDHLKLDVDITTHPAWTREANYVNSRANEVSKFNERYTGLEFLNRKK
jgi:large subunit ribosomal protein L31